MQEKNSATILPVDDDPPVPGLVGELLSAGEYQPCLASSGEEPPEIAEKTSNGFSPVYIDMPVINGIVPAKKFCASYPQKKVLFMSGYMLPATLFDIFGNPPDFLKKTFNSSTLIPLIKFIGGSRFKLSYGERVKDFS